MITADNVFHDLQQVRQINPVVHNITNFVVMQSSANILLAAGASPIMAHAQNELADIINIANALVINIGTLDDSWLDAISKAQQFSLAKKIPIVFDPVGAGATSYRTTAAKKIIRSGINILRANASEILSLTDAAVSTKGVDSKHQSEAAIEAANIIAKENNCVVVISGATDIVVSANQIFYISHGTPLFTKVTGMGCAATALIGAVAAINTNYAAAAAHAMIIFSIAGEIAAQKTNAPGSFYTALLDALFLLKAENFQHLNVMLK